MFNYWETIPRDWLVWEWLLDGDASDTSGSWNNWTATDITWNTAERWYVKEVGSFNGSSSEVWISKVFWLNDIVTINFNLYVSDTSTSQVIFSIWENWNYNWAWIQLRDDVIKIYYSTDNWWFLNAVSFPFIKTNEYCNITCVFSKNRVYNDITWFKWYINWVEQNLTNISDTDKWANTIDWWSNFWAYKAWSNHFWFYWWKLWLVRIYNRVLTEKEIRNLYLEWQRKLWPWIMIGNNWSFNKYTPASLPKPILHINWNNDWTTFYDQSGNWYNGTQSWWVVVNTVWLNKEIVFDWNDDRITLPDTLTNTDFKTVSFWLNKTNDTTTTERILDLWVTWTNDDYSWWNIRIKDSKLDLYYVNDWWWKLAWVQTDFNYLNEKMHIVCIFWDNISANDITWFKIYINWVKQTLTNISDWWTAPTIKWNCNIGCMERTWSWITSYLHWNMYNFISFSKTLTDKQIEALYYSNYI